MDEQIIEKVKAILMKYCNPKKEFDGVSPNTIAEEIIKAVRGY